MAAPMKYPDELRERAIRLVLEAKKDPGSASSACRPIGERLGINPETLHGWVQRAEIDAGTRPGPRPPTPNLAELEREDRELRRANAILRSTGARWSRLTRWVGGSRN